MDFEIKIFPIYGLAVGINYWDSWMTEPEQAEEDGESVHLIQVMLGIFGFSFVFYKEL